MSLSLFGTPSSPLSTLPIAPPSAFFPPKPQPMTRFHTLCLNRQPLLFKNPIFPPRHDFKYLHTSDRRHPPPYLLLTSPITDASSLCLAVWARVPTDFPVVSLPEPQSGVFQSRGRLSKVTPHSAAFFPMLQYKQKLCRRTSTGGVLFPVPFGTKGIKPCVFGNSKKKKVSR